MGHFVGSQPNSTPVIRTENGDSLFAFTMHQGGHVEHTDKLLDHRTADLHWADIRCHYRVDVDCTGRTIAESDIKIGGSVFGTVGAGCRVRAANQTNW